MKKIILLIISLLIVSGCGNNVKELSCTMTKDNGGNSIKQEILATYNEDKLENIEMVVSTSIPDENMASSYLESMKQNEERNYKDTDSVSVNTKSEGNVISLITNINYKTFSKNDEKVIAIDKDITFEALKERFEKLGYTCK